MKKTLFGLIAGALLATSAVAADLPARTAPVAVPTFAAVDPNAVTGFYVGARAGYATQAEDYVLGGNVGYDFGYFRAEANYDYLRNNGFSGHALTANGILEYSFQNGLTPYVLAGLGTVWSHDLGYDSRVGIYNVGAGLRYNVTSNIEIDGRYRYINTIEDRPFGKNDGEHVFTIGANYRF